MKVSGISSLPYKSTTIRKVNNNAQTNPVQKQSTNISTNKTIAIGIGILTLGAIAYATRKPLSVGIKKIGNSIKNLFTTNENKLVDISSGKGRDYEKESKETFTKYFTNVVKDPFVINFSRDGHKTKTLKSIANGCILTGPDSVAKEERFNWMLDEMQKAGAEIIDPGQGKKAKYDEISKSWWDMWNNHSDEEFKKTGKYKIFVVRGLDEIGQPIGIKKPLKYPEGTLLKDSPDTDACGTKHGILLFYTCKDTAKLDPAVIRTGRVDYFHTPRPNDDEPLVIWKEYLEEKKNYSPEIVVNEINTAKKILSKRGPKVMEEMEPHFAYSIPYHYPKPEDSIEKWGDYISKTSKDVSRNRCNNYLRECLITLHDNLPNNENGRNKFNAIYKMTEDIQTPEHLPLWRKDIKFTLGCDDIAYAGNNEMTGAEYVKRMLEENGNDSAFINSCERLKNKTNK